MEDKTALSGSTKLSELLSAYPWLKEALIGMNDRFKMLNSPLGKIMVKQATISEMSKRSGIDEAVLIEKLESMIAKPNKNGLC